MATAEARGERTASAVKRIAPGVIALLLFGSGFSALLYQTAWQRSFRLVFGASSSAAAAVLAVFLGGLGVGSAVLSRRAEKSSRPLFFYGNLELYIALFAATTPFLIQGLSLAYYAVGGSPRLGTFGGTVVRLVIALLVMGPPAILMGGTLPAAARAAETDDDVARGRLAQLYALNTLGAVLGALIGTFGLFELFGTRLSLWIGCLINLLVAITARALGRAAAAIPASASEQSIALESEPASVRRARIVYAAALVVGAAFIALELVWYRMLAPLLGGSAFTFGLVLAVALAGVGSGGYVYSRHLPRASFSLFGLTTALEALCVALPLALGNKLSLFAEVTRKLGAFGFSGLVTSWVLVCLITVFPAALIAGYQFPVLIALLGRGREQVAKHVGFAYAANTAGCVLGALATGFALIPGFGAVLVWRGVVVVLVLVAVTAVLLEPSQSIAQRVRGALPALAVAVLASFGAALKGPTATWRHAAIGSGRATLDNFTENRFEEWEAYTELTLHWEKDGIESSVALTSDDGYSFLTSGKADGSSLRDRGTQVMLGLIPAALHPAPKQVFVVGLGTGMTAGWLSRAPGVQHVDVAELEPAVLDVARTCKAVNHDVLARPNVSLFLGDGREFMLSADRSYDLIVSEPSNLYRAGVSSLFTRDFYEVVASRLAKNGLFAQWIQAYEIDPSSLLTGLQTMRAVFPYVEIWDTQPGDLVLLGSLEKRTFDAAALERRLEAEPFKTALPRTWLVEGLEGFLSHYIADAGFVDRLLSQNPPQLNTDDVNILEFGLARTVGRATKTAESLVELAHSYGADLPASSASLNRERIDELRMRSNWIMYGPIPELRGFSAQPRRTAVENGCIGSSEHVLALWPDGKPEPDDVVERYALGRGFAWQRDERALGIAERLAAEGYSAEAALIGAAFHARSQNRALAFETITRAVAALRSEIFPLCDAARNSVALLEQTAGGDPELATRAAELLMRGPFSAGAAELARVETLQRLAFKSKDPRLCLRALGKQLERPWWSLSFLRHRASCLERAGHPLAASARADVERNVAQSTGHFGLPFGP